MGKPGRVCLAAVSFPGFMALKQKGLDKTAEGAKKINVDEKIKISYLIESRDDEYSVSLKKGDYLQCLIC